MVPYCPTFPYIVFFKWKSNSLCLKNIQKKTNKGQTSIDVLKRAAGALRQSGKLRQSAREFNVSKTTLKRFVDQMSIDEDVQQKKSGCKRVGDRHHIFSTKMEEDLANHIKLLSNMFYGLSTNKCRRLAFEFAIQNNITIPDNRKKKKAGIDWFLPFKFKYGLSVRKHEATSLARATAFNRHTIGKFLIN